MIFASHRPQLESTFFLATYARIKELIATLRSRIKLTNINIVPSSLTIWDFLFNSEYSPLGRRSASELAGYTNAVTKERVRYDELKDHTTHVSTALVKKYGLQKGDTVALFGPNTIWYPVAMLATIRAGEWDLY